MRDYVYIGYLVFIHCNLPFSYLVQMAHIPNSIFFDVDGISDQSSNVRLNLIIFLFHFLNVIVIKLLNKYTKKQKLVQEKILQYFTFSLCG